MKEYKNVIIQGLQSAKNAIDKAQYVDINIYGNRIMSDAFFMPKNKSFYLAGFFIKNMSIVLSKLSIIHKEKEKNWGRGIELIDLFISIIEKESPYIELWEGYLNFINDIKVIEKDCHDIGAYEENVEYSRQVLAHCFKLLEEEKEVFYKERNVFINGIINELSRVITIHGFDNRMYSFFLIFKMLSNIYPYMIISSIEKNEINKKSITERLIRDIELAIELFKLDITNDEELYDKVTDYLIHLIIKWRKYFIFYMEQLPPQKPIEKSIELPKETKEKIGKLLHNALEKEIK